MDENSQDVTLETMENKPPPAEPKVSPNYFITHKPSIFGQIWPEKSWVGELPTPNLYFSQAENPIDAMHQMVSMAGSSSPKPAPQLPIPTPDIKTQAPDDAMETEELHQNIPIPAGLVKQEEMTDPAMNKMPE